MYPISNPYYAAMQCKGKDTLAMHNFISWLRVLTLHLGTVPCIHYPRTYHTMAIWDPLDMNQ